MSKNDNSNYPMDSTLKRNESNWTVGDNQPHPFDKDSKYISYDPKEMASSYYLTISSITPRPIGFVSTQSLSGIRNIAPYSYFGAVAHDPPTVTLGICTGRNGLHKDTLVNILETGEFVLNVISEWFLESANYTCGNFPFDIDEIEVANLTPIPSDYVSPPRIKESGVHMECKLAGKHEVVNDKGEVTSTVIFGRIVKFHVLEPLLINGSRGPEIDHTKLKVIGRLGGEIYTTLGEQCELTRPRIV
eukprot:gene20627-26744_t